MWDRLDIINEHAQLVTFDLTQLYFFLETLRDKEEGKTASLGRHRLGDMGTGLGCRGCPGNKGTASKLSMGKRCESRTGLEERNYICIIRYTELIVVVVLFQIFISLAIIDYYVVITS